MKNLARGADLLHVSIPASSEWNKLLFQWALGPRKAHIAKTRQVPWAQTKTSYYWFRPQAHWHSTEEKKRERWRAETPAAGSSEKGTERMKCKPYFWDDRTHSKSIIFLQSQQWDFMIWLCLLTSNWFDVVHGVQNRIEKLKQFCGAKLIFIDLRT